MGLSPPVAVDVDIYNLSYGTGLTNDLYMFPDYTSTTLTLEAGLKSGVETLRDGKGAIYIKSAGNDHTDSNNWLFSAQVCAVQTLELMKWVI